MEVKTFRNISAAASLELIFAGGGVQGQEVNPARFEVEMQKFRTWDSWNSFPKDAI